MIYRKGNWYNPECSTCKSFWCKGGVKNCESYDPDKNAKPIEGVNNSGNGYARKHG